MSDILRRGRLGSADEEATRFTSSLEADRRIAWAVKRINEAHAVMLAETQIIDKGAAAKLLSALRRIDIGQLASDAEDIHSALEVEVARIAGAEAGGNLHLAKSRNDQVSTAIRMELRRSLLSVESKLVALMETILEVAKANLQTLIPALTHAQPAQPTTYAHYLVSHHDSLGRDLDRMRSLYGRVDSCPMGACAVCGTSFPISRERMAELLGFKGVAENTMDAVGSRDFAAEAISALALLASELSRLAADFALWSGSVIELPDELAGASSIMPQKKNPDVLELVRAKAGVAIGNLTLALAIIKGLPSSYNLDFQEITPRLWSTLDDVEQCLTMMRKVVAGSNVRTDCKELLDKFTTFTELANALVRDHGIPFRTAHQVVAAAVKHLTDSRLEASEVTSGLIERISRESAALQLRLRTDELKHVLDPWFFVTSHSVRGGPSPASVSRMIEQREAQLSRLRKEILNREADLAQAEKLLESSIEALLPKVKV